MLFNEIVFSIPGKRISHQRRKFSIPETKIFHLMELKIIASQKTGLFFAKFIQWKWLNMNEKYILFLGISNEVKLTFCLTLYCNFPRYSLEEAAFGISSLMSGSSSFSTRKSSSSAWKKIQLKPTLEIIYLSLIP